MPVWMPATLVRSDVGVRLIAPDEMALLMGFPRHRLWQDIGRRLGLAHLGNAISPAHATIIVGRARLFAEALQGRPIDSECIATRCASYWKVSTPHGQRHQEEEPLLPS